jgi:hypothetical protein
MNKEKIGSTDILEIISNTAKNKNDVKMLTKLSNIIDEGQKIQVTYKGNNSNPEIMDFFLGTEYIESCRIQPKIFLDFRASKIQQGFTSGISFAVQKMFKHIQDSNENK